MAGQALIAPPTQPTAADLADIQGLVYRAYNKHCFAGYLFATLGDDIAAARGWLDRARRRVTPASERGVAVAEQIALSATGLVALGLPDDAMFGLPQEIKEGMAGRTRVTGDVPTTWTLGGPGERLDVLVMVYARDEHSRTTALDAQRELLAASGAKVRADELAWQFFGREHFGFADGLSQPFVPGVHGQQRDGEDPIATGEIVLGYQNAYGKLPQSPMLGDHDLGRNGTYLVFRKLDQDVVRFWTWIAAQAKALGDPALVDLLGAKLIGRWRSGAPLVLSPDKDDPSKATPEVRNRFTYLDHDPAGKLCPISSHVRRANPRDARGGSKAESIEVVQRHRILRRGRSYGPPIEVSDVLAGRDDHQRRGLYFIGLQASIARSFEFIQQTWLSNPGFAGGFDEADPVTGPAGCFFTIPSDPLRLRLRGLPQVVTTQGGGYFMLPSLTTLAAIAKLP